MALWDAENSPSYRVCMTITSFSKEKLCMCDSECVHAPVVVALKMLKVLVMVMVLYDPYRLHGGLMAVVPIVSIVLLLTTVRRVAVLPRVPTV